MTSVGNGSYMAS